MKKIPHFLLTLSWSFLRALSQFLATASLKLWQSFLFLKLNAGGLAAYYWHYHHPLLFCLYFILNSSSSNPKDWLIRDKEGSFIDNDTEDIIKNGCEGWTICENHSSVFILLCNIFWLYLFNNGSFLFTISTLKSIIIKQYLQGQQHHNFILSWLRNRCVWLFKSFYTSTICLTTILLKLKG